MKLIISIRRRVAYVQFVSDDPGIHSDMPPIPVRRGGKVFGVSYLELIRAARKTPGAPVEFPDPPQAPVTQPAGVA